MKKLGKASHIIVLLIFLVGLCGPAASPAVPCIIRAHPILQQLAAQSPDQAVTVIVQKAGATARAEALTVSLGGNVTRDLHIINAFTAEIKASQALKLAASPFVRWVSPDTQIVHTGGSIDTSSLASTFVQAVGADRVWNESPAYLQGQGVTVALVDSGECSTCQDLNTSTNTTRYLASISVLSGAGNNSPTDFYGHGTLVAGVIGANGFGSNGKYMGVAPAINFVSVKVSNNLGEATSSSVVSGLQWVLENKVNYNIRVVNLAINSSLPESSHTNPIDAAVEILWFNGIVVITSAGNNGTSTLYPPANDPFVITVGATNDNGTSGLDDDVVASFSAYGITENSIVKPDLVAPGTNLVSIVPSYKNKIFKDHASHRIGESNQTEYYMRVSGTSFAAPVVSGAVALLLQFDPTLTPDQVKYRLMATANKKWPGYDATKAGAGYLDIYTATHRLTTESANTGITASQLLWTGSEPITWGSVAWNSVAWNSVAWNSVAWNSVAWNSVAWNSDYWEP